MINEKKEYSYTAKLKLKNGEQGYLSLEWGQGEELLFTIKDINDADFWDDAIELQKYLNDYYKDEIESYELIQRTVTIQEEFILCKNY